MHHAGGTASCIASDECGVSESEFEAEVPCRQVGTTIGGSTRQQSRSERGLMHLAAVV